MRTKQSAEFEKQESTWIYLLHQQAPPQTRLSAEASLALPPLDAAAPGGAHDAALFGEAASAPTLPARGLLLPPPAPGASAMVLSSQDKSWTPQPSTSLLSLPRLSDRSTSGSTKATAASPRSVGKRACFPKKCDFPMCKNSSRSRGFCYSHGGGRRCSVDGCNNGAVSRDLCKRHGGGRRCRIAGCKSSSESGGLCYSHGGGRRCSLSWCSARAKKGGFCAVHLTGDRTQPPPAAADGATESSPSSTSSSSSSSSSAAAEEIVHPNVVETLLSLAKDQSSSAVKTEPVPVETSSASPTSSSSGSKSAYAIASLLN
ncbi:hypothetical protein PHYSODRAFT_565604 [Phytophthora sojae]|uniref:WRKY19-like zinc finger domain-containing protein n=1 Tax=Phytophthora sojae (strain P6497) TaxID=1094619 RepID=G5AAX9_PHYSP|nr:hypothetical protein PHYSODRAFT_565604 [Phytophthora sojae]EGZ07758.1 hypothetical protein PHYSODRAFT_565604 [Phytophthora sojae]|eukprot:XP_009537324.1 hypothetical protein PHYSODRAFT_565604 [Phytophthora sojae]